MRPGHKLGCPEKGFEPDAQVPLMLVSVEQGQLVDKHGPEREPSGIE
jgi:hypothetical protein